MNTPPKPGDVMPESFFKNRWRLAAAFQYAAIKGAEPGSYRRGIVELLDDPAPIHWQQADACIQDPVVANELAEALKEFLDNA